MRPNIILKCNLNLFLLIFCWLELINKYVPKQKTTKVKKTTNNFVLAIAAKVVPSKTPIITNKPYVLTIFGSTDLCLL